MFQISVNGKEPIELADGKSFDWDLQEVEPGVFHILKDGKGFRANVVSADVAAKSFVIQVNGRNYEINVKDRFDLLLEKLGMDNLASTAIENIKAPMPGLVIDVMVEPGQSLSKGDQVLILEAMKMENVIKAQADCVVKSVNISKGNAVEKGETLVELEG